MMKRQGIYQPTIEETVEISGIEILHPGGYELTQRTAELCDLKKGIHVLDVSSGRGTQAIYYAQILSAQVTGLDISEEMVDAATRLAKAAGLNNQVMFVHGDSQKLPFDDNSFDVVINECAVGIPDDSQKVLNEMVRVAKPGGSIAIHESTWRKSLTENHKNEISERYGTTPLEFDEWHAMLRQAGVIDIVSEFDEWSTPNKFWEIRKNRNVKNYKRVMTFHEKVRTAFRIFKRYGIRGVFTAFENEKLFYKTVLNGELGYALFKGVKEAND
jgi:SAM-dependent methyltransferase